MVVPEFARASTDKCRRAFYELIGDSHVRVDPDQFVGDSVRPRDEDMRGTVDWLRSRGRRWPDVQIAALGVLHGKKIRIDLYKLPEAELVGLKTFVIGKGCRMSARSRHLAREWLDQAITVALLEPVAIADPPPKPEPEVPPIPTATVAESPPPEPEPEPEPPIEPEPPPATELPPPTVTATKSSAPRMRATAFGEVLESQPLILVDAGVAIGSRSFEFIDPLTLNLGDYSVDAMPVPWVRIEAFPFALIDTDLLAPLGIDFGYGQSVGLKTVVGDGVAEFPSTFRQMHIGARYRFAVGEGPQPTVVLPQVHYRVTSFLFDASDGGETIDYLPSVSYGQLSFGLAAEVSLRDNISLLASGAYLLVFDPGEGLAESAFFKKSDVNGFLIDAALRFQIIDTVGAQVGAGLENYFLEFESDTGDINQAKGARDQIIRMQAAVHIAY